MQKIYHLPATKEAESDSHRSKIMSKQKQQMKRNHKKENTSRKDTQSRD